MLASSEHANEDQTSLGASARPRNAANRLQARPELATHAGMANIDIVIVASTIALAFMLGVVYEIVRGNKPWDFWRAFLVAIGFFIAAVVWTLRNQVLG